MISAIAKDDLLPFSNCYFGVLSHHNLFSTFKQVDFFFVFVYPIHISLKGNMLLKASVIKKITVKMCVRMKMY